MTSKADSYPDHPKMPHTPDRPKNESPFQARSMERHGKAAPTDVDRWLGEGEDEGSGSSWRKRLLIAFSIITPATLAIWIASNQREMPDRPSTSVARNPEGETITEGPGSAEYQDQLFKESPMIIARAFANATSVEERLKWARDSEIVKEHLPTYTEEARTGKVIDLKPLPTFHRQGINYFRYLANLESGSQRLICVIGTPNGPRVDWDCFARHNSASWEDISAGAVSSAEIRAYLEPSARNTYSFSDPSKWLAFAITSRDLKEPFFGYIARPSELARTLAGLSRAKVKMAILRIKIDPEEIAQRQFQITDIVCPGWVKKSN